MMRNFNKALEQYLNDMENILKDEKTLKEFQTKTMKLFEVMTEDMINANAEKIMDFERKMNDLNKKVERIYGDIYEESDECEECEDFEITCPYCNSDFFTDLDESKKEIICPDCSNVIELDWNCDSDNDHSGCSGNCSHCDSCDSEE